MRTYANAIFNHFRALRAWAAPTDARLELDVRTFELEVRYRNRYYVMQPLFQTRVQGELGHTSELTREVFGFGGWRPYRTLTHPLSTHKLQFRSALEQRGLRVPRSSGPPDPDRSVPFDHLVKADAGSFGTGLRGPFRAGRPALPQDLPGPAGGLQFVEEFIRGRILKVWFWGDRACYAQAHGYPFITGDGTTPLAGLLQRRARLSGMDWDTYVHRPTIRQCLDFQGLGEDDVLPAGTRAWIDFRFAHHHLPIVGTTAQTDDALPDLTAATGDQIARMGATLGTLMREAFPAPVFVTVDGMLDDEGRIHWLEMNTNSVLPPEAYPVMLADLFG